MATITTTTDTAEAVKTAMDGKGTVTVYDDAGQVEEAAPEGESTSDSAADGKGETTTEALLERIRTLESRLSATKEEPVEEQAAPKVEALEEPKADDFDTNAEYLKALSKWAAKQARLEDKAEREQEDRKSKAEAVANNWRAQVEAAKKKYPDWNKTMGDIEVGQIAASMLIETSDGADISYFIGKNPAEAAKLAAMRSEREVAIAIGELRVRSKLASEAQGSKPSKPAPITPVKEGGKGVVSKKPEDMTYQEYKEYRQAQLSKKA